jgi:hypothetical protein
VNYDIPEFKWISRIFEILELWWGPKKSEWINFSKCLNFWNFGEVKVYCKFLLILSDHSTNGPNTNPSIAFLFQPQVFTTLFFLACHSHHLMPATFYFFDGEGPQFLLLSSILAIADLNESRHILILCIAISDLRQIIWNRVGNEHILACAWHIN